MEIRFIANTRQVENLKERMDVDCAADLAREGMNLLDWAIFETERGNRVVAITTDGAQHIPVFSTLLSSCGRKEDE